MLRLKVLGPENYDEVLEEFVHEVTNVLRLEHSLSSISKWESKWELPFLDEKSKTNEQTLDYINFMILDEEVPPDIISKLSQENMNQISEYINAKMRATWFSEEKKKPGASKETVTSEVIYYWMVSHQIPFETDQWHFNKLLTLIKVCNEKNQPEKKMSKSEMLARNQKLNAERKAQMKSKG